MNDPRPPQPIQPASNADAVRIGLCTDTHLWLHGDNHVGSKGNLLPLAESGRIFAQLVEELAGAAPDIVLHLGDFTCGGGYYHIPPSEFYAATETSMVAFARLSAPVFGLPGNHDCPPGTAVAPWRHMETCWGLQPGLGRTIDTPYARLILLNAQGHEPAQIEAALPDDPIYGWVSEAELARLEADLAGADDKPVILFCHQLLQPWRGDAPWREYYLVQNAPAVLDILAAAGNVAAVFQGHAHMLNVHTTTLGSRPCTFVIAPAIIEYPLGWLELTLCDQGITCRLRLLDLPELRQALGESGLGQFWRAGREAWHNFTIPFARA